MAEEMFREGASFAAMMLAGPYIVAAPIAVAWVTVAWLVRWATGWAGLLPADVWNETR